MLSSINKMKISASKFKSHEYLHYNLLNINFVYKQNLFD